MPSPLLFPSLGSPAPTAGFSDVACAEAPVDSSESFDAVLTKAEPDKKSPPDAVSVQADPAVRGLADTVVANENGKTDPALLSEQELAALLALIGAPAPLPPPPSPPPAPEADTPALLGGAETDSAAADTPAPARAVRQDMPAAPVSPDTLRPHGGFVLSAPLEGARKLDTPTPTPPAHPAAARESAPAYESAPARESAPAPTVRQLLAQGIDRLDFTLDTAALPAAPTPASKPTPERPVPPTPLPTYAAPAPYTTAAAAPTPRAAPMPEAAVMPVPAAPALSSSATQWPDAATAPAPSQPIPPTPELPKGASSAAPIVSAADQAGWMGATSTLSAPATTPRFTVRKTPAGPSSEKFAESGPLMAPTPSSGVNSSPLANKNNFLMADQKELRSDLPSFGTRAANWGDSMIPDTRAHPSAAAFLEGAAPVSHALPGFAPVDRAAEPAAVPAPQAAQMVREIRDIADSLWAVERNSVEVRFHFTEKENLSVKVEYRDGVVTTTFRTESPELRDTLAREWHSQIASASEARPYRVADPVFSTPAVDARGFSLGGDASRQQRQPEQPAPAPAVFATTFGRASSSSVPSGPSAPAMLRPDTALHLHAFA
jgi:hypothetical protein